MTAYEVFVAVANYYNYEPEIVIQEINELIGNIELNPKKFLYDLSKEVEDFGLENEKCPLCGSNLITTTHAEYREEYCGSDCYEEMVALECEDSYCNFTHK